ncbi:MAG: MCE family protein [Deltaproteobacteria bacterium]|nr:MCE family protein [Candidatus Zymogenaceae bacterium]
MAKKTAQEIRVGLFIFIGLILAFIVVFSIGGKDQLFREQYTLYTHFKDVGGLIAGSPVRLAGVEVGTVSRIWFLTERDKRLVGVELKINASVKERIHDDSTASIRTMGVLGDKYIAVTLGSPDKPVLADGDFITSSETVELLAYLEKADKIVNNIEDITDSLNEFMTPLKEGGSGEDVARILKNTDTIVTEIKDGNGTLHSLVYGDTEGGTNTMESLNNSAERLDSVLTKIDSGEGSLGALVNDPTLYEDLKTLMGGAKRSKILNAVVGSTMRKGKKAADEEPKE